MDIKRKKNEKRIQLFGGLIGICVAVVSLLYFFHAEKEEAEKRMVEIVNYVTQLIKKSIIQLIVICSLVRVCCKP